MSTKFILILTICLQIVGILASIETSKPVQVTNRNSGPRYDIDEVERTRLTPSSENENNNNQQPPSSMSSSNNSGDETNNSGPSIGHLSIRRIFLVPMMPGPMHPPDSLWSQGSSSQSSPSNNDAIEREQTQQPPSIRHRFLFGGPRDPDHHRQNDNNDHNNIPSPFLPFHHLFGQDSASRSPFESKEEKPPKIIPAGQNSDPIDEEASRDRFQSAILDPIQMMIEMMQQALHQAHTSETNGNEQPSLFGSDLNKEASSSSNNKPDDKNSNTELDRKLKPLNETKEEIVEIDGKKYLRKTVVNRHVGENIIFMTKRLVFVPLNETESATGSPTSTTTTTTTTETPTSTEQQTSTSQPTSDEIPIIISTTTSTELPKKIDEIKFDYATTVPSVEPSSSPSTTTTTENVPTTSINRDDREKAVEDTTTKKDVEEMTTNSQPSSTTAKPAEITP